MAPARPVRIRPAAGAAAALGLALWLAAVGAAPAQEWAVAMFDHTSKDLGVVARGAKVEHTFTLENIYLEDAHVASIRSSCGCTTPTLDKPLLKTYEKGLIKAVVDTRNFEGRKEATLTVTFDKPFPAEVQLNLYCYIRRDVVFQPGSVQFGSVPQGRGAQCKVTVNYAGRSDWRILKVESPNASLETSVAEVSRIAKPAINATDVTYDLVVKLRDDAPAGYLRDQLILVTDDPDPRTARVPLGVEGVVTPSVVVKPSPLVFGPVAAGATATKPLVIQGPRPFRVVNATSGDGRFSFILPGQSQKVQLLPVTFTAGTAEGRATDTIRIETDLSEARFLEVKADAQVVAAPKP